MPPSLHNAQAVIEGDIDDEEQGDQDDYRDDDDDMEERKAGLGAGGLPPPPGGRPSPLFINQPDDDDYDEEDYDDEDDDYDDEYDDEEELDPTEGLPIRSMLSPGPLPSIEESEDEYEGMEPFAGYNRDIGFTNRVEQVAAALTVRFQLHLLQARHQVRQLEGCRLQEECRHHADRLQALARHHRVLHHGVLHHEARRP